MHEIICSSRIVTQTVFALNARLHIFRTALVIICFLLEYYYHKRNNYSRQKKKNELNINKFFLSLKKIYTERELDKFSTLDSILVVEITPSHAIFERGSILINENYK